MRKTQEEKIWQELEIPLSKVSKLAKSLPSSIVRMRMSGWHINNILLNLK